MSLAADGSCVEILTSIRAELRAMRNDTNDGRLGGLIARLDAANERLGKTNELLDRATKELAAATDELAVILATLVGVEA